MLNLGTMPKGQQQAICRLPSVCLQGCTEEALHNSRPASFCAPKQPALQALQTGKAQGVRGPLTVRCMACNLKEQGGTYISRDKIAH